jgi:polysaccharide deacetylase family protein (PEP-CTERM system associated)
MHSSVNCIAHAFTMDVEEFCEGNSESLLISSKHLTAETSRDEIERNVDETLEVLAVCGVRGTFFILAHIVEQAPEIVRKIVADGHEIGSHSLHHLRLHRQSLKDAKEAIVRSKKILEDIAGVRVRGFRAPDFSISKNSSYLLDMIREAGYEYDSSLYPISGHDVYGVPGTPRWPYRMPNGLIEYPLSTFQMFGQLFPALGGGYFRLYPFGLTRRILRSLERKGYPAMCYIHPYEFGACCPEMPGLSVYRRFRHYVNRNRVKKRFEALFREFRFTRADEVLSSIGLLG